MKISIIYRLKSLSKTVKFVWVGLCMATVNSCDFLDVVPDNVSILDHAFSNSTEAEKFLFTCYAQLPQNGSENGNVGFFGADEAWLPKDLDTRWVNADAWNMARGEQNTNDPYHNAWAGEKSARAYFKALRLCNIFLENIQNESLVRDLPLDTRTRWIGEALFLKAYYHYLLLRMYGPIPLIDKNIPVSATPEETRQERIPVDSCVNYIAQLYDQAYAKLPAYISRPTTELGRVTQPILLACKAKLYLLAASPLFNGNTDYVKFKNMKGEPLFNQTYDENKWLLAATAAKKAIDAAENNGAKLYYYENNSPISMTDETITQMNIRNSICDPWNDEIIWGNSNSRPVNLQNVCMALINNDFLSTSCYGMMAPPLKMVEMFYTKNGVPINEDKDLAQNYIFYETLRTATDAERINIQSGQQTAALNFDREPRFYADLAFDRSSWLLYNISSQSDQEPFYVNARSGESANGVVQSMYSVTGYFVKKLVHWESTFVQNGQIKQYPWPEIRLADLYLMYAEALNESKKAPDDEVYYYIDEVRRRAGLDGVKKSWQDHSTNPSKPTTKVGMREIIQRERTIELAFEGHRFWDLRRWKTANEELNRPIQGWDINQKDADAYYQKRTIFMQKFVAPRDYLWPIQEAELRRNTSLIQNPGW
ncbi:RagB/SusD family nutrient uptake outer membrane protein [Bacteroides faecis]|jgi:hypothetical protein|uniref:RagB/SusD family nutrient uptake outer membrane protein n=1 Tax=Bacteroides faecis TaxID=674529 RepID=UPI001EF4D9CB|nr:RagB/SusD family nutrient uptake outer membrane protein [Bacteroides faecis]MCS2651239.1 RagB/SusD family nutrient uptake outer membrane protein [Bacteroides faecis]UYU56750.1 RagB/SusD family nutrient uptake outer membrane protein [Bacteroides faecis]